MKKNLLKYLTLPVLYMLSVLLMEFYPNIIAAGIWLMLILLCLIALILLLRKKLDIKQKILPIVLLCIPIADLTFGITNTIRDEIKGKIVLSAIDDGFATSNSILVREKNGQLNAEYDFSAVGFGSYEKARINILNDSVLYFEAVNKNYSERLTYDRIHQLLRDKEKKRNYRILKNELLK